MVIGSTSTCRSYSRRLGIKQADDRTDRERRNTMRLSEVYFPSTAPETGVCVNAIIPVIYNANNR